MVDIAASPVTTSIRAYKKKINETAGMYIIVDGM